jgi:hypothetical protein
MRTAFSVCAVAVLVSACGGNGGEVGGDFAEVEVAGGAQEVDVVRISAMSDEEKALHVLEVAGFARERIVPDEDGFLVDGDISFSTADLVARANDAMEKGYWCGRNQFAEFNSNTSCLFEPIQMNMSTGIALIYFDPDQNIDDGEWNPILRNAFLNAARFWSQAHDSAGHGSELYIDGRSVHKKPSFFNIEIRFEDLGSTGPIAKARWPVLGTFGVYPGSRITVNSNAAFLNITFNTTNLSKVAIHELGHTLGFAHPESFGGAGVNFQHIAGSSSGTGYGTVMHSDYNSTPMPALYPDDEFSLVSMYSNWANDLPATPNSGFCKESTGAQMRNGCDVGEGDCDGEGTDTECKDSLECINAAGEKWELPSHYDVCEKPSSCPTFQSSASSDYCNNIACPCGPWEGDCDLDSQCGGRLICGTDLGPAVGKGSTWDICILPPIPGCPVFNKASISGYGEFCSTACPCNLGEGDCDSDDECRGDLKCVTAGSALGYGGAQASWEFCVSDDF